MITNPMRNIDNNRSFSSAIIGMALISGFVLTVIGLSSFSWPAAIPWSGKASIIRFFSFLLTAVFCISLLTKRLHWNALLSGGMVAAALAIAVGGMWPLLVTLWFSVASALLGRWILGRLRIEDESLTSYFLVGAGTYGTSVGLLAHFPAAYPGVYGLMLALPLLLGRKTLQQWYLAGRQWMSQSAPFTGRTSSWLDSAIAVVGLAQFVVAFMPELGYDPLVMHLFVPAQLFSRHQWGFDVTTYVWAVMPMLGDWIFSIGYMLGGETAARLIDVSFIFLLGWLVRDLVLWAGGTRLGARWAVLIFLSTPLTFYEGSSLFIESVFATFAVAGTLAVLKTCSTDEHQKNQLLIAGALLGCALATKAVTFTILPVLLLILIWRYKTWLKSGIAEALFVGLGLFLIFGSPPYVTAWWLTGNPVFPFFNKLFQSPLWAPVNFEAPAMFAKGMTWDILYRATFQSQKYLEGRAGSAGFQWLLLFFPALIAVFLSGRRRGAALIIVGVVSVALTFHSTAYLRYVFPEYALLAAAIGLGMTTNHKESPTQTVLWICAAIAAISLNVLFWNASALYGDFPLSSIVSKSNRETYLAARLPIRNAVKLVNALNADGTPVAVFADEQAAGLAADAIYASWYNGSFEKAYFAAKTDQALARILLDKNIDFLIVDSNWNALGNVSRNQLALIDQVSSKISQIGSVSVRRLKDDYRFKKELLTNPDFSDIKGWSLSGDASYAHTARIITANVTSPGVQEVPVRPRQLYRDTIVTRCHTVQTLERIQVNWNDAKGKFIKADIRVVECTPDWQTLSMDVRAPSNAASAAVYASGQTATPVEFKSVSFK